MQQLYRGLRKTIFVLFILIKVSNSNAQKIRPFAGAGAFVHLYSFEKDLQSSPALSFSVGSEYKAASFLLPEIEVNYMFGNLKDKANSKGAENTINTSEKSFSTINFSFCPKIVLGDYNDGNYIQILPKYIFSLIDVRENIVSNSMISTQTEKSLSTSQHAIGLGVGYVINFDTWHSNSLAINVCYNTIRVSEPFDQLNPGTERTDNVGVYGLEFKYYFGVKRLK